MDLNLLKSSKKQFTKIDSVDLYKYYSTYSLSLGLTPDHDLAFLCQKV